MRASDGLMRDLRTMCQVDELELEAVATLKPVVEPSRALQITAAGAAPKTGSRDPGGCDLRLTRLIFKSNLT